MNFRLRASKLTDERLQHLHKVSGLTPNILARIAVALSLKQGKPIEESELVKDTSGQEFNRNTLTGHYDYIFKALIAQNEQREISDEEFFPALFNAHLERGTHLLNNEYTYAGNFERLITNLVSE